MVNMNKILVLGGFGFLGAHVVRAFARQGYEVEAASRRTGVDARDESSLMSALDRIRPDVLIHCAAHVGGIAYNAKCPVEIFEDNLQIGFHVVRAAARACVNKLVNIMPNCTYPGELDFYSEAAWWNGPMHPTVLTYGMPRKALWVHAWAYRQERNLRSIHLVLPNLYGPGDHFDVVRSHALGALIRKICDAQSAGVPQVEIWGTGSAVREWMYAPDAAEGIVRATERYDDLEVLNIGSGEGCSIRDLAELIRELAGWTGELVYDPSRPDGAPRKLLDPSKMRAALDWFPPTPLRAGIQTALSWYREHGADSNPRISAVEATV